MFTFAKSSNKHTDKKSKMQPIVNVRGSITHLPVGDSVRFEKWMTTPRYVRQLCSDLANERGWMYRVSSKKDSPFIEVTRYE